MLSLTPQMRILVAVEAIDFRNGIDGLAGICRNQFQKDPLSGCVFVFRNRRGTSLKVLVYDGQGFWLCQKRLSKGRFRWRPEHGDSGALTGMEARELQLLLWNGDPSRATLGPLWRKLE
ncbi:MAG: IS66 family insertion sequence element accessory protein TnpB [bacterium]|jgi:transposase